MCCIFGFLLDCKLKLTLKFEETQKNINFQTLAIVFLAGANRINIFSVGYLIGSFIFLWQVSASTLFQDLSNICSILCRQMFRR